MVFPNPDNTGYVGAAVLLAWACTSLWAVPVHAQLPELQGEPRLTIGVLDGPDEEVFGDIVDVQTDRSGNIFVLDRQALELRWFGPDGRFLGRAGGEGAGPGELRAPSGLGIDADGQLHVLDIRNVRISTYEPTDSGLVHVGDAPQVRGYNLCVLGHRRYVVLPDEKAVIHEVGRDGSGVRSFGEPEPLDRETERELSAHVPVLRALSNRGPLHCDSNSDTVLLLSERLPLVRAFSSDGEPLWRMTLEDYHRVRWESGRGGRGVRMAPDPGSGSAHTGRAITTDAAGRVIVTLHEGSLADPDGRLETRVLSSRDGEEVGRTPVPMTITAVQDGRFYGYSEQPFPRVLVF